MVKSAEFPLKLGILEVSKYKFREHNSMLKFTNILFCLNIRFFKFARYYFDFIWSLKHEELFGKSSPWNRENNDGWLKKIRKF